MQPFSVNSITNQTDVGKPMSQSQNPYEAPYVPFGDVAAQAALDERAAFIRNTYLHLLGAILAFAAIIALVLNLFETQVAQFASLATSGYNWFVVLGAYMGISYFADKWAHSNTARSTQYLGLGVYVLAKAIIFLPLLYFANTYASGTIASAGIVTAVVFGGLTMVVFFTKADFSFLRYALVVGGFVALGLIAASIFLGFSLGTWFAAAMVVLMSGSILYSTSNVLHHYRTSQYVAASLSLFASVALLFYYVLQLFMAFDE